MEKPTIVGGTNLHLYVGHERGHVVVDFGTNLSNLEMEPEQAAAVANLIMKHALAARPGIAIPMPAQTM